MPIRPRGCIISLGCSPASQGLLCRRNTSKDPFALSWRAVLFIFSQQILHGDAGSGGSISQIGREILFEAEDDSIRVPWVHKMMNVEDHADIDELRTVLKLDEKATLAA